MVAISSCRLRFERRYCAALAAGITITSADACKHRLPNATLYPSIDRLRPRLVPQIRLPPMFSSQLMPSHRTSTSTRMPCLPFPCCVHLHDFDKTAQKNNIVEIVVGRSQRGQFRAREWYASYFLKKSSWRKGKRDFRLYRHFVAESLGQNFSSASLCRFISRQGEKQRARASDERQ